MLVPLRQAEVGTCGPKAATLGQLARAGFPVPDGFVVPFDAYRPDLVVSPALVDQVSTGLDRLGNPTVAVRSSAAGEDGASRSAAGQYESVLRVHGSAAVAEAIATCWASVHSPRAQAYHRSTRSMSAAAPRMAVLIQTMVDADASGVLFTAADDTGESRLEAATSLGAPLTSGRVTPQSYRIAPGGTVTSPLPERPVVGLAALADIAIIGERVADNFGEPQDIEWAVRGNQVWLLQARPITAALPGCGPVGGDGSAWLRGTPGSEGVASGPARPIGGPDDFARVRPGDVLVCRFTDPSWTPLFRVAAAVVTETGGVLSHAAIVAREYRVPAVLGVHGALTSIRDGETITVDGSAGTIERAPT